jgi:hypothetical protein
MEKPKLAIGVVVTIGRSDYEVIAIRHDAQGRFEDTWIYARCHQDGQITQLSAGHFQP